MNQTGKGTVDEDTGLFEWYCRPDPTDQIAEAAMAAIQRPESWDDVVRALNVTAPLIAAMALDGAADALRRGTRLARPREPYQSIVTWLRESAEHQRAQHDPQPPTGDTP